MGILTRFFLLTFLISWACFITVALLSHQYQIDEPGIGSLLYIITFIGTIAPALVALWLLYCTKPPGQAQALIKRIGIWQLPVQWYLFAAVFMAAIKLLAALLHLFITDTWPAFGGTPWYIMLASLFISTWVQAGEEIGWRGLALPRLTERLGLPLSTIFLGMIWALWHLPLFYVKGASTYEQSFPLYLVQVTALSVAMGWLYWRTGGSLLLVMLLHAAINNTKDIVPSVTKNLPGTFGLSDSLVGSLTAGLLWIAAGIFLYQMRSVKRLY